MKKLPAYKEAGAKCTDIMIILENGKIGKKNNREKSEVLVADCYCTRVGTFGTESAVRKRGGSRNLPYLNAANSVTGHVCVYSNCGFVAVHAYVPSNSLHDAHNV